MRAIITGASGQDGSYLSELLLSKGYDVYGLIRQSTQFTPDKYGYLRNAIKNEKFHIEYGDVTDASGMRTLIETIQPDEVYNLAAQSHVGQSFEQPLNTFIVTAQGPLNLLEAIRRSGLQTKFYEASSSEMFGKVTQTPQSEVTTFYPRSPYGCAKVFGHYITKNYREAHGIFACSGILFNHESERRGENFVTRKITRAVGRIKCGLQSELKLGPLDIHRDWGYAPDYVEAMWMMLQHDKPDDWVIGTGVTHSIQEFVELAFKHADLDLKQYVQFDKKFVRPSEVDTLRADITKASDTHKGLGWAPKVNFENLVKIMVDHDIKLAKKEIEHSDE